MDKFWHFTVQNVNNFGTFYKYMCKDYFIQSFKEKSQNQQTINHKIIRF